MNVSGCGAAWLARLLGVQEVPGSNPGSPTKKARDLQTRTTLLARSGVQLVSSFDAEGNVQLMGTDNSINERIVKSPGICGGRAHIVGHRVRVQDIVSWHEHQGMTPDEIVSHVPSITLADGHDLIRAGVHPSLSNACSAARFSEDTLLGLSFSPAAQTATGALPPVVTNAGARTPPATPGLPGTLSNTYRTVVKALSLLRCLCHEMRAHHPSPETHTGQHMKPFSHPILPSCARRIRWESFAPNTQNHLCRLHRSPRLPRFQLPATAHRPHSQASGGNLALSLSQKPHTKPIPLMIVDGR